MGESARGSRGPSASTLRAMTATCAESATNAESRTTTASGCLPTPERKEEMEEVVSNSAPANLAYHDPKTAPTLARIERLVGHPVDAEKLRAKLDAARAGVEVAPVQVLGAMRTATRLAYISPMVDQSDGAVSVWAPLPADSRLRPGQYVRLRIVTATHRMALAAPSAGVITDVGKHGVLSVVRGHEAIRVPVRIGIREHGWVEVSGPALRAGTQIVTVGAYGLPSRVAIQIASDSARDPVAANAQGPETP